jgi:hypothetical protein
MSRKWTPEIKIPQDSSYIIRCIEESFAPSKSSNNPMITLKFELVSPEEVEVAGELVNVAGVQPSPLYIVTQAMDESGNIDVEKSANGAKRLKAMYTAFGLPNDNVNPENPALGFKGKVVYALLYPDTSERRKSPTAAQLAAGQKQGDIMINPVTKQPLVNHYIKIGEIFGLAPTDAAKPY